VWVTFLLERLKAFIKRYWPVLRLRTIIFGTLLFVAALPGFSALFLRVYENALVRQTEAELIAQGAALVAATQNSWPEKTSLFAEQPPSAQKGSDDRYNREPTTVDLSAAVILPPRPDAVAVTNPADPSATKAAAEIAPVMTATSRVTLAAIQFLDKNGVIVAGYQTGRNLAAVSEFQTALSGNTITVVRRNGNYHPQYPFEWLSRASGLRLHHARPIYVGGQVRGVLLLTRSPRVLFQGITQDVGKIAFGVIAIFLMLILLTAILSRAIVRPVESLSRATRAVAAGRGNIPESPGLAVVEIRNLYADFHVMAQAIIRRSAYLRDFAASVSHEFKTPLSGIRGGIELLQDHGDAMSEADRKRFLNNMTSDADRLSQLVGRLMQLAQADMHIADPEAQTDLKDILPRLADGFDGPDLSVEMVIPIDLHPARLAAETIEAVIVTLLENSRQAGAKCVQIKAHSFDGMVLVDVIDNGPGIAPGDRHRIFDPFFTSKRATGGTGLGLAIAQSLLQAGGAELMLRESATGAHFQLRMRSAQ
jgi:two-component system, OmpR family, sensor histidine kinase ChvG